MREVFRNLFVKYLPGCDYARGIEFERKRDQEVHELRTAAATIKKMLCKGYYFQPYSAFMCVAVSQANHRKELTDEECIITRKVIATELGDDQVLAIHMRYRGERLEDDYDGDEFVARIARSVWYWQFIKRLQLRAAQRSAQSW
jgi:hypothetical protein